MSEFKIRRLDRDYEILPNYGPRFAGVFVDKDTGELWVNADGTQRAALQPKCQTVAGAGTNQATATVIDEADGWLVNATGGDGTVGVKLPAARAGISVAIYNAGSGILKVYPGTSDDILDGTTNVHVSVASHVYCEFYAVDATTWAAFYTAGGTNATLTGEETLTNKTLTSPVIAEINSDLSVVGTVESADATTPILSTAAGKTNTGYLSLAGKTSGSFKVLPADATAQVVTLGINAQTSGAATLNVVDRAGVSGRVVVSPEALLPAGADETVAALTHTDRIVALDTAAGSTITLPAATGSGARYTFIVSVKPTSNQHRFTVTGNDTFKGQLLLTDQDGTTVVSYIGAAGSNQINLNGTTTGGQVGDRVELVDILADVWAVTAWLQCAAGSNVATPLAAV